MSNKKPDPSRCDYAVGYGKPPVQTRFKPGQSGNPRGRSKKSGKPGARDDERLKQLALEEAYRPITILEGNRRIKMTVMQAVLRSIALNAAKGDGPSQGRFLHLVRDVEGEEKRLRDEFLKTVIEYKVEREQELATRAEAGRRGPDPVPHPDDIAIDLGTGTVEFTGPMTAEDKQAWESILAHKRQCENEIARLERMLMRKPGSGELRSNLSQARQEKERLDSIIARVGWRETGS